MWGEGRNQYLQICKEYFICHLGNCHRNIKEANKRKSSYDKQSRNVAESRVRETSPRKGSEQETGGGQKSEKPLPGTEDSKNQRNLHTVRIDICILNTNVCNSYMGICTKRGQQKGHQVCVKRGVFDQGLLAYLQSNSTHDTYNSPLINAIRQHYAWKSIHRVRSPWNLHALFSFYLKGKGIEKSGVIFRKVCASLIPRSVTKMSRINFETSLFFILVDIW